MAKCKSNKDKYEDDIDEEIERLKKDFIELVEIANEKQTKELKEDIKAINTRIEENFRAINSRIDQIHIRLDQIMQLLAERR